MYEWRMTCRRKAQVYASQRGLKLRDADFGHLEHFHYGGEKSCEALNQAIGGPKEMSILDLGCGIGASARSIVRLSGREIIGVDTNGEFIEYGRTHSPSQISYHLGTFDDFGLIYDAWFALLLFVHVQDPMSLVERVEQRCRQKGLYWVDTIIGDLSPVVDGKTWTMDVIEAAFPDGVIHCMNHYWSWWTCQRLERFFMRRSFFEELYGAEIVRKRCILYENVAEGFESGKLEGRRIVGKNCQPFEQDSRNEDVCIIEFDQIGEV